MTCSRCVEFLWCYTRCILRTKYDQNKSALLNFGTNPLSLMIWDFSDINTPSFLCQLWTLCSLSDESRLWGRFLNGCFSTSGLYTHDFRLNNLWNVCVCVSFTLGTLEQRLSSFVYSLSRLRVLKEKTSNKYSWCLKRKTLQYRENCKLNCYWMMCY